MGKELVAITWQYLVTVPHTAQVSSHAVTKSTGAHLPVPQVVGSELEVAGFAATTPRTGARARRASSAPVRRGGFWRTHTRHSQAAP